jgi:hypothetical protein
MNLTDLLSSIDSELDRLQQVRTLLAGDGPSVRRVTTPAKKRVLSAEARELIAAAQRKRWAAQKRAAKKAV